ncbi:transmembrane protein 234 homolog [Bombus affinis]|uniref:Transmembrane protein 234 homolog n=1 Tax=Bombus terrestris TaxID=30195 RepID=A0A9B0C5A9_BOMTE|nr:transmembrane protein 234 homolog [Bombus terrestris]XP_050576153.1 transmembrane protein 234 homolog [Bombus affinis]
MSSSLDSIIFLILVAFLWGVTNPFIKKGAKGLENVKSSSKFCQFFKELAFLITNLKYIIPFIINQCGSVLYFLTLNKVDISLAIPVTNSLTFVITAITGWILGEEKIHKNTYMGMILILVGTVLCSWDKIDNTIQF